MLAIVAILVVLWLLGVVTRKRSAVRCTSCSSSRSSSG
jgi:hypothetical protein